MYARQFRTIFSLSPKRKALFIINKGTDLQIVTLLSSQLISIHTISKNKTKLPVTFDTQLKTALLTH